MMKKEYVDTVVNFFLLTTDGKENVGPVMRPKISQSTWDLSPHANAGWPAWPEAPTGIWPLAAASGPKGNEIQGPGRF